MDTVCVFGNGQARRDTGVCGGDRGGLQRIRYCVEVYFCWRMRGGELWGRIGRDWEGGGEESRVARFQERTRGGAERPWELPECRLVTRPFPESACTAACCPNALPALLYVRSFYVQTSLSTPNLLAHRQGLVSAEASPNAILRRITITSYSSSRTLSSQLSPPSVSTLRTRQPPPQQQLTRLDASCQHP